MATPRAIPLLALLALAPASVLGQLPGPAGPTRETPVGGATAFRTEATGAAVGSLLAIGASYAVLRAVRGPCPVDDLGCHLGRLGWMGLATVPGSALGGYIAGRAGDTQPSVKGLVAGAIVGVAAGAGAARAVEALGVRHVVPLAIVYAAVQGSATAAGSRIWR